MIARTILEARIAEVREALRRARLMRHLAAVFAFGILVRGTFLLATLNGFHISRRLDRWSMLTLIVLGFIAWLKGRRNIWSDHDIARIIEHKHPSLDALLLTAIEHESEADEPTGFLHERLIDRALAHAATQNWPVTVAHKPYTRALVTAWLAVIAFLVTDVALRLQSPHRKAEIAKSQTEEAAKPTEFKATLTPGDTELERGTHLIIEARFNGPVPADATLVVSEADGKVLERLPMRLTVDEQVYGGMINKVERDTKYHVEFADQKSQTHTITVFDFPALVRSDVIVTPPEYTKLPAKETKNTQKVTALEGSKIAWKIKVNKPLIQPGDAGAPARKDVSPFAPHLTAAELFGEDKTVIVLSPSTADATVLEGSLTAEKTQKYRLHLVDEAERGNKNPPWFTVTVQSNQLAKIEVVFPKRDLQVSSIQELPVEAKVSDDLGVTKSGAVFSINGNSKEIIFKHPVTAPLKKQDVRAELALEKEHAEPRQLVSYYLWAEDTGPKGEVRRNMSDMFFADVRHFEDIFREMEAPPSEPGQPKAQSDKLVELVKQIVNATWKIIRDTNAGRVIEAATPDIDVVHQSVGIALEQVKEGMEKAEDTEVKQALTEAWKSLKDAQDPLHQASAEKKRSPLNQALTFEQTALEWLHRAQSREHQVIRQNSPSAGLASKNEIMDLELKQKEQRYEEEKAATEEQTAEQQENLQVLNRLKELARRQEALAEKMKELQNQIANAKTEDEKQELDNQLKRLQAEQEQLLRDVDDLKERMEKPDNAQNMAEAKEQLEKTREKVMEAAEQLKDEKLADAANSATRAQRELEKMQEDFRQKTSKKFADEVKQIRQQARDAAENQKKISEALENQKEAGSDIEKNMQNAAQSRQVTEQQENIQKLLNSMRQLSEQAEQSEPLLHRNLYDTVRKAQTSGLEENLQETRDQLRYGSQAEAKDAERKAANAVEELKKGVEKAAESVLGSESEALRVAKNELDKLIKEAQQQETAGKGQEGQKTANAGAPKDTEKPQQPGAGQPKDSQTAEKGDKPGEGKEPGKDGQGQPQDPKMAGQGQQPGKEGQGQPQPGQGKEGKAGQGEAKDAQTAANGQQSGQDQQPGEKGQSGQQPNPDGKGQGQQQASAQQPKGNQPGQQPGKEGQQPGQPGQGKGLGEPQTAENSQQPGEGQQPGQGQKQGRGQSRGQTQQTADTNTGFGPTGDRDSDNDRHRPQINGGAVPEALFFDDSKEQPDNGVFTGGGYEQWSDRLRNVEELLNNPELRNEAAKVLDRARSLRIELKRSNEAPQVAHLNTRITQPLMELRDRVVEELSKKDAGKNLAPVDRDPVPAEFRDLVKRYYQELGAGK